MEDPFVLFYTKKILWGLIYIENPLEVLYIKKALLRSSTCKIPFGGHFINEDSLEVFYT